MRSALRTHTLLHIIGPRHRVRCIRSKHSSSESFRSLCRRTMEDKQHQLASFSTQFHTQLTPLMRPAVELHSTATPPRPCRTTYRGRCISYCRPPRALAVSFACVWCTSCTTGTIGQRNGMPKTFKFLPTTQRWLRGNSFVSHRLCI